MRRPSGLKPSFMSAFSAIDPVTPPRGSGSPTWRLIWIPSLTNEASALPVIGKPYTLPRLDSSRSGIV